MPPYASFAGGFRTLAGVDPSPGLPATRVGVGQMGKEMPDVAEGRAAHK
ncbi:hypothetical protein [Rubrobacter tropicus]|nr:hypothetical protein [Rubrobacter tropicus]